MQQSERYTLKTILTTIDVLIEAQETARVTESVRLPLEVALAKLTYNNEKASDSFKKQEFSQSLDSTKPEVSKSPLVPFVKKIQSESGKLQAETFQPEKHFVQDKEKNARDMDEKAETGSESPPAPHLNGENHSVTLEHIRRGWDALTTALSREKMSLATYVQEGQPIALKGQELTIAFSTDHSFHKEALEDLANVKIVSAIFSEKLKIPVLVKYTVMDASPPSKEESHVQQALDMLSGKVVSRWHNEE